MLIKFLFVEMVVKLLLNVKDFKFQTLHLQQL